VQDFLWWVTCELELPIFTPSVKYLLNGHYKCSPQPPSQTIEKLCIDSTISNCITVTTK
jgi:hypothetical protein